MLKYEACAAGVTRSVAQRFCQKRKPDFSPC
jgi:hypothetical protein